MTAPLQFDSLLLPEPAGWIYRHLLSFRVSRGAPREDDPNIVVARLPRVETLEGSVLLHLLGLAKRLPELALLQRTAEEVSGRAAIRVHLRAVRGATLRQEVFVYVDAPEGDLLVLSCSWRDGDERADETLQAFARMLAAARFTRGASDRPSALPFSAISSSSDEDRELPGVPMPGRFRATRSAP